MATASPNKESHKALVADTVEVIDALLKPMSSAVTLAKMANANDEVKNAFSRARLDLELKRLRLINSKLSEYQAALDTNTEALREATGGLSKKLAKIKSISKLLDAATSLLKVLANIFT